MLKLTFTSAKQVNDHKEAMEMIYSYKVSNSEEAQSLHVMGVTNSWNMSAYERFCYAQYLFTGAMVYLKRYWHEHKSLPEATELIWESSGFGGNPDERIAWHGHHLNLL